MMVFYYFFIITISTVEKWRSGECVYVSIFSAIAVVCRFEVFGVILTLLWLMLFVCAHCFRTVHRDSLDFFAGKTMVMHRI